MYLPSSQYSFQNSLDNTAIICSASQNSEKIRGIIGMFSPSQCANMRKKASSYASRHTNRDLDDGSLTQYDKEAWWEYLKHYLPNHYALALALKNKQYDQALDRILSLNSFNYNQLFDIYGLPAVQTKDHRIVVGDKPSLEIIDRVDYEKRKRTYSLCHEDRKFYRWKEYQYIHCQDGKCAWCENPVEYSKTEVDHIRPLFFGGKNVSWNLVVACKHCNSKKWTDCTGWNDSKDTAKENKKPSWITSNKYDELWRDILKTAHKKELAEDKKITS